MLSRNKTHPLSLFDVRCMEFFLNVIAIRGEGSFVRDRFLIIVEANFEEGNKFWNGCSQIGL